MTTHIALLRAINVGGRALVKMEDLRKAFERAGCLSVRTYINSGNVLFELPAGPRTAVLEKVCRGVGALLGNEPDILYRTGRELERIVADKPFKGLEGKPAVKFYVVFLSRKAKKKPKLPYLSVKEAVEIVAMTDREICIVSRPKKNGFYGFPNGVVESELGVSATSRNWNTVTKLVELAQPSAKD